MPPKPGSTPGISETPIKKARRGTKRSRSGCLTCKFRKVKCDEAKPECSRCQIFGIKCDGYEKPRTKLTIPGQPLRPQTSSAKLLPAPSSSVKFENEMEQRHFQMFQTEVVSELSGTFDTAFWNRLVLQGCQEPFILKTVIALSALSTAKKLSQNTEQDHMCNTLAAQHREFAFVEYQKALQVMAVTLEKNGSPRKALLMCLLVCCFEGLAGNTLTAVAHAKSGQKLLNEWLAEHPHKRGSGEGIKSPAGHLIEDELIQAAAFFELQIVGFFDSGPKQAHSVRKHEGTETIAEMPANFRNVEEARVYWQLIQRRIMHFISEGFKSLLPLQLPKATFKPTSSYVHDERESFYGPTTLSDDIRDFRGEQSQYCKEVAKWRSSFHGLYRVVKRSSDKRLIAAAQTLLVTSRSYEIVLIGTLDSHKYAFNSHLASFREIVSMSREIIQAKKDASNAKFFFEMGVIPALHMTAKWCPDLELRRDAIALLKWYASREGHWDSMAIAEVNTVLLELEEGGTDGETILEKSRIRRVDIRADSMEGWIKMDYIKGSVGPMEEMSDEQFYWRCPPSSAPNYWQYKERKPDPGIWMAEKL